MQRVVREAPAKINLWLSVVGKRADGYHELDSLVAFAQLADRVEINAAAIDELTIDGLFADGLSTGGDNLVWRAVQLVRARAGRTDPLAIRLTKNIPVAAGLGGGSCDAAATLLALQQLWQIAPGKMDLATMAAQLGADVPMCVASRAAVVGGVGEQERTKVTLPSCAIVLVNPRIALPTADVFRAYARTPRDRYSETSREVTSFEDLATLVRAIERQGNDLLAPARCLVPAIGEVIAELRASGTARYAGMSGSGATCFALAHSVQDAAAISRALSVRHPTWWTWSGPLLDESGLAATP